MIVGHAEPWSVRSGGVGECPGSVRPAAVGFVFLLLQNDDLIADLGADLLTWRPRHPQSPV